MKGTFNSKEWIVWEQNASPMLLVMTLNPSMADLRSYLGSPLFTTLVIFETDVQDNYQGKWLFRYDEGRQLGQKMVDMLLCPPYRVAFNTGVEISESALYQKSREIQFSIDLEQLSNKQLVTLFEEFCHTFYDYYKLAAFVEPVQWRTEQILTSYLTSYLKGRYSDDEVAKNMRAIFTVAEDTFAVEILEHMGECAEALGTFLKQNPGIARAIQGLPRTPEFPKRAVQLIQPIMDSNGHKETRALSEKLEEHSSRYFWKSNNYFATQFVTAEDVLLELLEPQEFSLDNPEKLYQNEVEKVRTSKRELLVTKEKLLSAFPAYFRNVVAVADQVASSMVDHRKRVVMTANSAFDRIFGVASHRTNTPITDVRLLIPQEFSDFMAAPEEYRERFAQRKRVFIVFQSDFPLVDELLRGVGDQSDKEILDWHVQPMDEPFIAEGDEAERVLDRLDPRLNLFTHMDIKATSDMLQGLTTYYDSSEPMLEGKVRVIKNPKTESLVAGEILVASSTTPDFIDAIRKCRAIVTDWGGQTSHAAITSRELKKPCIIGTNFASQVLRSGDYVRLDLTRGLVGVVSRRSDR